jgi:hypothetical protein
MSKEEKNTQNLWIGIAILGLILAFSLGQLMVSPEVVEKEIEVEVQKIIEVPGENITIEVFSIDLDAYLEDALSEFWDEAEDRDDALKCDGHEYDRDEISEDVEKWGILFDEDDYSVWMALELRFKEDDSRSCREDLKVDVFYEEDEQPEVSIKLA